MILFKRASRTRYVITVSGLLLILGLGFLAGRPSSWARVSGEPTDVSQPTATHSRDEELYARYVILRNSFSPEQRVWEEILEAHLGEFYFPLHEQALLSGIPDAWDFVAEDPKLPRVLLIGDSISRGYTLAVRTALAGIANVQRAPENCGATANGVRKLDLYLGKQKWEVIHFNFGIHDRATPVETYERNLETIVARLEASAGRVIWASTTPVVTEVTLANAFQRETLRYFIKGDPIVIRNTMAARVATRHGIAVNDLHLHMKPRQHEYQIKHDVHFTDAGYEFLGQKVAHEIKAALATRD